MSDFRVTVKVRNARLLRAIEAKGYVPGSKFCNVCSIPYHFLVDMLNMSRSPLDKQGKIKPHTERLIEFLGVPFDDLFTERQIETFATNKTERDISAEEIYAIVHQAYPTEIEHDDGLAEIVSEKLGELTPRERRVLTLRFGLDGEEEHTLLQIAEMFDVGQARIRQIEAKAKQKLRYPKRRTDLVPFLGYTD